MEIGIIGLPLSGKTTLFNALTRSRTEVAAYSSTAATAHFGVTEVPDVRLKALADLFHPKRVVPATVKYVDPPAAPKDFGKGSGVGGQYLAYLSNADALIHVVRVFQSDSVPHIEGKIDPARDIATVDLELAFSDLTLIERRKQKLAESLKGARAGEREAHLKEEAFLNRLKAGLEKDIPLREQGLMPEENRAIEDYQFLTAKPLMMVLNIDESQLPQVETLEKEYSQRYGKHGAKFIALCGKLEMELAQMEEAEAHEFRQSMGLKEAALDRFIRLSYELLGLLSFFTVVSGEVKAWTVRRETTALKAAGKIHTDMERGFIRAEVVAFNDLMKCGSMAEARRQGLLRLEGKGYAVQDGDVITFLFNV